MHPTPAQCERRYRALRRLVDRRMASLRRPWAAHDLGRACDYVLAARGKRVRAVILLLSCKAVGGNLRRALPAAAAVEAMHNFTLVHDDIMDHAATRRGRATVHVRWDQSTALLTGDVLLGLSYASLSGTKANDRLFRIFTRGLLEVCDGQALDLAFERRRAVSVQSYFRMIEKKTAHLIAMAAELGALLGGGTPGQVRRLRAFGFHLGRAFQLQDDLLDVCGDEAEFGKAIGGDILEGKRTFLLLRALERAAGKDRAVLRSVMNRPPGTGNRARRPVADARLIAEVTAIYERTGATRAAGNAIRRDTARAQSALRGLPASEATAMLGWLAARLLHRSS